MLRLDVRVNMMPWSSLTVGTRSRDDGVGEQSDSVKHVKEEMVSYATCTHVLNSLQF